MRVDLSQLELKAEVSFAELDEAANGGAANGALRALAPITAVAPLRLQRRGAELRLVLGGATAPSSRPDPLFLRTLFKARRRVAAYLDPGEGLSVSAIADREGVHFGDVSRSLQLAFLAPDLVESILDGVQPLALTAERLKRIGELPLLWEEQRALLA